MAKFRSKPVTVEAFQWIAGDTAHGAIVVRQIAPSTAYVIGDNHRRLNFKSGDWIVVDERGRVSIMEDAAFRREFESCEGGFLGAEDVTS